MSSSQYNGVIPLFEPPYKKISRYCDLGVRWSKKTDSFVAEICAGKLFGAMYADPTLKHPRINDYKTVSRDLWGKREDKTVFVENINYRTGNCDLAMELVFNDPGSEFDGIEYVRFINVLTPQKVKLILKNCPLYSDERELLESIMRHLNLPTDKESVDKEIENYVGLYELI